MEAHAGWTYKEGERLLELGNLLLGQRISLQNLLAGCCRGRASKPDGGAGQWRGTGKPAQMWRGTRKERCGQWPSTHHGECEIDGLEGGCDRDPWDRLEKIEQLITARNYGEVGSCQRALLVVLGGVEGREGENFKSSQGSTRGGIDLVVCSLAAKWHGTTPGTGEDRSEVRPRQETVIGRATSERGPPQGRRGHRTAPEIRCGPSVGLKSTRHHARASSKRGKKKILAKQADCRLGMKGFGNPRMHLGNSSADRQQGCRLQPEPARSKYIVSPTKPHLV